MDEGSIPEILHPETRQGREWWNQVLHMLKESEGVEVIFQGMCLRMVAGTFSMDHRLVRELRQAEAGSDEGKLVMEE